MQKLFTFLRVEKTKTHSGEAIFSKDRAELKKNSGHLSPYPIIRIISMLWPKFSVIVRWIVLNCRELLRPT